jgi:uncharacterized membrane protein
MLTAYIGSLVMLLALDALWLGVIAKSFYKAQFGDLMLDQPRWPAALLFYGLYAGGIVFFAIMPALKDKQLITAILHGAVLGFIAYMTYDLSSYATLKGFPVKVVAVDIIWGTFVTAASAAAGAYLSMKFGGSLIN